MIVDQSTESTLLMFFFMRTLHEVNSFSIFDTNENQKRETLNRHSKYV